MKKVFNITFPFLLFMILVSNVKADYSCYYNVSAPGWSGGNKNVEGHFEVLEESKEIKAYSSLGIDYAPAVIDSYLNGKTDAETVSELGGFCSPLVYVCEADQVTNPGSGGTPVNFVIIHPALKSAIDSGDISMINYKGTALYMLSSNKCYIANYDELKSDRPAKDMNFACEKYNSLYESMKNNYCSPSDPKCDISNISIYNSEKDKIKSYCKSVLSQGDYINPCVKSCSKLGDDIAKLEGITTDTSKCGFSEKLIGWILNIIKWIKYIIPVIVIILGIIDFIRAIASDKDDEMKKAQGRFVKRLIAAALIFIVPFILEFVLDKMGFSAEGCGIINFD